MDQRALDLEVEDSSLEQESAQAPWPGRRTLTQTLVSRKAKQNRRPSAAEAEDALIKTASSSGGVTLPDGLRRRLEASTGVSLQNVRLHAGADSAEAAAALGARAFTVGDDVHFGAGEYPPLTPAGEHLIAHEVAHTVQKPHGVGVSSPSDSHEAEAEGFADRHMAGERGAALTGGGGGGQQLSRAVGRNPRDLPRTVPLHDYDGGLERTISEDSPEFRASFIDLNIVDVMYWSTAFARQNPALRYFSVQYENGLIHWFQIGGDVPVRIGTGGGLGSVALDRRRSEFYRKEGGLIWPDRISERTTPMLVDIATTIQLNHNLREQFLEMAELTSAFSGYIASAIGILDGLPGFQQGLSDLTRNIAARNKHQELFSVRQRIEQARARLREFQSRRGEQSGSLSTSSKPPGSVNNDASAVAPSSKTGEAEPTSSDPTGPAPATTTPGTEGRDVLLAELATNGVKHTPDQVISIGRAPDGQIVFLEAGNARAGLAHIVARHGNDFAAAGISEPTIPGFVMAAVTRGKQVAMQNTRPGFEVNFQGSTRRVAVQVGSNGFIVGANPVSMP